jgi:small subunit ribosomal protein S11
MSTPETPAPAPEAAPAAAAAAGDKAPGKGKKDAKKKVRRTVSAGRIFISSSYNNTIVSVTDTRGNVLAWDSSGTAGFTGSRKSTPFAAQLAAEQAINKAVELGMSSVDVLYRGPGSGKDAAVRLIQSHKSIKVGQVRDVTSAPHNGCRPKKRRRV